MHVFVYQEVLGLQITMHDLTVVTMTESLHNLCGICLHHFMLESSHLANHVTKCSILGMVKDKVQMFLVHECELQSDDEWLVDQGLQHFLFPHHRLLFALVYQVLFVQLLYCHRLVCFFIKRKIDHAKATFSNLLVELEVVNACAPSGSSSLRPSSHTARAVLLVKGKRLLIPVGQRSIAIMLGWWYLSVG